MSNIDKQEVDMNDVADIIGSAMSYVANEAILLAKMEEYFTPKAAKLWETDEEEFITTKLNKAVVNMGGAPESILMKFGDPLPVCDTYPEAALREVITAFNRARKSVNRAHLFKIGSQMQREHPDWFSESKDNELNSMLLGVSENAFWEHAETAYIRLASYWDRVGQLLDFAFFRIRQFERDGFSAVFDRIRTNVIQINTSLGASDSWKAIRKYQTSEKDNGLKWLLRRRNITVHSLHLRAIEEPIDEGAFKPMYNHLEEKLNARLAPRTPAEEIELLHTHLSEASALFTSVIDVVEYSFDLNGK